MVRVNPEHSAQVEPEVILDRLMAYMIHCPLFPGSLTRKYYRKRIPEMTLDVSYVSYVSYLWQQGPVRRTKKSVRLRADMERLHKTGNFRIQ